MASGNSGARAALTVAAVASWSSRPSLLTVNHFIEMRVRQASSPTTIKNSVAALTTSDLLCMDRS